jgi:hypothetical protein
MAGLLAIAAGDLPENTEELAHAFRAGGITAFQQQQRKFLKVRLEKLMHQPDVSPLNVARLYTKSGDFYEAFRWLDKAYDQRVPMLVWVKSGIAWEHLRNDPRYHSLLRKMNLPE